jgi:hypothetical protein
MQPDANTLLLAKMAINGAVTISGLWFLVWYQVNRKWNKDELKLTGLAAMWTPITRYRVEIIIGAVLIPDWADVIPKLFGIVP